MGNQPISNLQSPSHKVALLTGASRPPGPDLARNLAEQGWHIALNDLNPFVMDQIAEQIIQTGGKAQTHIADVSQKLALQTILNDLEDEWGHIDLLINNTRVMPDKPLLDMDEWDWRHTLDINLTGAFLLTQVVGRMMRARGGGTIIHLFNPDEGEGHAAYAATQAGLEGLVRVAEKELHKAGLQVHIFNLAEGTMDELVHLLSLSTF